MLQAKNLSYSVADRCLFKDASFSINAPEHCVLIGTNGAGKTTLIDMLLHPEDYLFRGKVIKEGINRVGYVNQFIGSEKDREISVYDYLCEDFDAMQADMELICAKLETAGDSEELMEEYQRKLDEYEAADGYEHEVNIDRRLRQAGLDELRERPLSRISGGEYKLVQIIRRMLLLPDLLVMDEPDVFLDFENLRGLRELINTYQGTILAATHNRYLLNHCFDKLLQIEDESVTEYDGTYIDFCFAQLQMKIAMQETSLKESEFISFEEAVAERLRDAASKYADPKKGRALRARVSYLERWKKRHVKEPYIEGRMPYIRFPEPREERNGDAVLTAENYSISFERVLLENVGFEVKRGEKAALVGPNGTGKTTLLRDIYYRNSPGLRLAGDVKPGFLSQFHGETLDESKRVWELMDALGFVNRREAADWLEDWCFDEAVLDRPVKTLSGGEKNLLQLAVLSRSDCDLLLLDEPTSHLDLRAQTALEKAVREYRGTVLMVSHDFYTIANCMDYVLFFENSSVRRMSGRAFRKMIYKRHFPPDYLELEQKKKELELRINALLQESDFEGARALCTKLDEVIEKLLKSRA